MKPKKKKKKGNTDSKSEISSEVSVKITTITGGLATLAKLKK